MTIAKASMLFAAVTFSYFTFAQDKSDDDSCRFAVSNAIKELELDQTVNKSGIEEACRFSLNDQRIKGVRTHQETGSDYCTGIISQHWGKRQEVKHKIGEFCKKRKASLKDHMDKLQTKCGGSQNPQGINSPEVEGLLGLAPCAEACQQKAINLFTAKIQERCEGKSPSDIQEDIVRMKDMVQKSQLEKDEVVAELLSLLEDARNLRVTAARSAHDILNAGDQGTAPSGLPTPPVGGGLKPDSKIKAPNGYPVDPEYAKKQRTAASALALLASTSTITSASPILKKSADAKNLRNYDAKLSEQLYVATQLAQAEKSYREVIEKYKLDSAALGKVVDKMQGDNIDGMDTLNPNNDPSGPGNNQDGPGITGPSATGGSGAGMLGDLMKAGAPIAAAAMSQSQSPQDQAAEAEQAAMAATSLGNGILNGAKEVGTKPTTLDDTKAKTPGSGAGGSSPYYSVQQQLADYKDKGYRNTSNASTARPGGNRGVASGGGGGSKGSAKDAPKFEKLEPVSEILDANSAMSDDLAGGGFGDMGSSFDGSPSDPAPSLDDPMKEMVDTMKSALGLGGDKDTGGGFFSGGDDPGSGGAEGSGDVQATDDTSPEMMDKNLFSRVSDYFNEKCLRKGCVTIGVKEKISF